MALNRAKYRRVPDLYTTGLELVHPDGTIVWLQVINPFERDEALKDAQAARGLLVMALKSDHGSRDRIGVEGHFLGEGRDKAIERLIEAKVDENLVKVVTEIRDDKEWAERLTIMERASEIIARPREDPERDLLDEINSDYLAEVNRRQEDERAYLAQTYSKLSNAELTDDYIDHYITTRGAFVAQAEYNLTELWYAIRCCDATAMPDGSFDHDNCENHYLQLYESKEDIRKEPEHLQEVYREHMNRASMSDRDARFSRRQGSSSVSSPLPSAPVESTPSIPEETPAAAPGPSAMPSGMR